MDIAAPPKKKLKRVAYILDPAVSPLKKKGG